MCFRLLIESVVDLFEGVSPWASSAEGASADRFAMLCSWIKSSRHFIRTGASSEEFTEWASARCAACRAVKRSTLCVSPVLISALACEHRRTVGVRHGLGFHQIETLKECVVG